MSISFRCLMCGQDLEGDETLRGQQTECGKCNAEVLVPEAEQGSSSPVIHRGVATVTARSHSTKSVFRSKRKAQVEAEETGQSFDAREFDGRRMWKVPIAAFVVLAVAMIGYLGYLAIPPARVPLTDEEATKLFNDVTSENWEDFLTGQCDSVDKLNAVMTYVRNDATYEEVFLDLKRLSDIIVLEPVADQFAMDEMERMQVNKTMGTRQMHGHLGMSDHLTRIKKLNPRLANRIITEVPVFELLLHP